MPAVTFDKNAAPNHETEGGLIHNGVQTMCCSALVVCIIHHTTERRRGMTEAIIALVIMVVGTAIMVWWHIKNPIKTPQEKELEEVERTKHER